ncbi:fructose PTS transporter subunit IIA [Vallitaleaceae bacterium 9-2]
MLITSALIDLNMEQKTKEEVVKALALKAKQEGRITDLNGYFDAVMEREAEYSTAVGFGVAIPHGKTNAVSEAFLAFGRVQGIDWKALDDEPVYNVFLIGVPEEASGNTHLQILAKLSRKLMKKDFRASLNEATSSEQLLALLKESEIL